MKVTQLMRKALPLKTCGAVIVAAGSASRMGGIDKVMAPLNGEPMIVRTVRTFQNCDAVKEIVIVTREDLIPKISSMCGKYDKVRAVVVGGSDRAESVRNGLNALSNKVIHPHSWPEEQARQASRGLWGLRGYWAHRVAPAAVALGYHPSHTPQT